MPNKKQIFHKPTVEEIKNGKNAVEVYYIDEFINTVLLDNAKDKYFVFMGSILPEFIFSRPKNGVILSRTEASWKFMKHGPEVKLPRYESIDETIKAMPMQRKVPVDIREKKYDMIKDGFYSSYSFIPVIGNDKRKRKVALIEICDGALLYAYASMIGALNEVMGKEKPIIPYSDSKRVAIDGASVGVIIPSRSPKKGSYKLITISGIPVVDNNLKYAIANSISTDHVCEHKSRIMKRSRFSDDHENSPYVPFDTHDIAGIYAIYDYFWNKEHNIIPFSMSQFALPSKRLAELSDMLRYNTLVFTKENTKQETPQFYPLNDAEREIVLEKAVINLGHNEMLFCNSKRDGDLRDYKWRGFEKR